MPQPKLTPHAAEPEQLLKAAEAYNIPYEVLASLVHRESSNDHRKISKRGAIGLTQLMPRTAKSLGVDPRNLEQNLMGGAKYLAQLAEKYKQLPNPLHTALVAYNAGMGKVARGKTPRSSIAYADSILKQAEIRRPIGPIEDPQAGNPLTALRKATSIGAAPSQGLLDYLVNR